MTVLDKLRWTTLTLTPGTLIDEQLRQSETGLLYQVEHQFSPDPLMRPRLLRYFCRIRGADLRDDHRTALTAHDRAGWNPETTWDPKRRGVLAAPHVKEATTCPSQMDGSHMAVPRLGSRSWSAF